MTRFTYAPHNKHCEHANATELTAVTPIIQDATTHITHPLKDIGIDNSIFSVSVVIVGAVAFCIFAFCTFGRVVVIFFILFEKMTKVTLQHL